MMSGAVHQNSDRLGAPGAGDVGGNEHRRHIGWCVLLTVACLLPFVGKAFHIDDTVFLRTAQHIQQDPIDFYGLDTFTSGKRLSMAAHALNPPLMSYVVALVALVAGWHEVAMHLAMLVPAVAACLGTYCLARRFCTRPLDAAAGAVLTPVFLVSSTTVMCDVLMVALYIWAIELWARGLDRDRVGWLVASGACAGVCFLVKYFGLTLVPLLAVYGLLLRRRPGWWLLPLAIPFVVVAGYEWMTYALYGRGLFYNALFRTSSHPVEPTLWLHRSISGLCFAGGCNAVVLFFTPLLWRRRSLVFGGVAVIVCVVALSFAEKVSGLRLRDADGVHWVKVGQVALFTAAGLQVLVLVVLDLIHRRDESSCLLACWILGTFVFTTYINWSVTARTILPMAPALGIVLARRIDHGSGAAAWKRICALGATGLLSIAVARSDTLWANSVRDAVQRGMQVVEGHPGKIHFHGRWGFQWYMESFGARPLDMEQLNQLAPGDLIVVAENNLAAPRPPAHIVAAVYKAQSSGSRGLAVMWKAAGAGFYSDKWGPMPFAIGPVPPDRYTLYVLGERSSELQSALTRSDWWIEAPPD